MRGLLSEQLEQSVVSAGGQNACGSAVGMFLDCESSTAVCAAASDLDESDGEGRGDENDACGMSMMLSMSLANAAPLSTAQDSFAVL